MRIDNPFSLTKEVKVVNVAGKPMPGKLKDNGKNQA